MGFSRQEYWNGMPCPPPRDLSDPGIEPRSPVLKADTLASQLVKNLPANAGDMGSILGSGRSPVEGNGNPLPYSCLENPMDGGAWWAAVHGVAKSRTRLSDFTLTLHFHALEEDLAATEAMNEQAARSVYQFFRKKEAENAEARMS